METLRAVLARYAELAPAALPRALALATLLLLATLLVQRLFGSRDPDRAPALVVRVWTALLLLTALAIGLARAGSRLWLADDAFISFRYAQNLIEGHGLVFNLGERVEGYTNFLWTILLSALMKLSIRAEHAALGLGFACYLVAVLATGRLRRAVLSEDAIGSGLPGSHLFLAVQGLFVTYATSGLETMMCTSLVMAAAACRFGMGGRRGLLWASSCLTLATLGRPDHVLFYAALGIELLVAQLAAARRERPELGLLQALAGLWKGEAGRSFALYLAPMVLLYAPYFAWRYAYYGFLLPNTFYVKSGGGAYYSQGLVYVLVFLLATHFWLLLPLVVLGVLRGIRDPRSRGLAVFASASLLLYGSYVVRVGGDFMYGRFLVVLVPLLLLLTELGAHSGVVWWALARRGPLVWAGRAVLVVLPLAVIPFDTVLQRPGEVRWGIADEPSFYPVASWLHPEPQSRFAILGQDLHRLVKARGVAPLLGLESIGMAGFYSRLPILDFRGLTDTQVAHQPVAERSRPGHEKEASDDYVFARAVRFAVTKREFHPPEYRALTRIQVGRSQLSIVTYDREMMRHLAGAPEVSFVDFEEYLDRYIAALGQRGRPAVAKDVRFFRRYYFRFNDDREREGALTAFLESTKRRPPEPALGGPRS